MIRLVFLIFVLCTAPMAVWAQNTDETAAQPQKPESFTSKAVAENAVSLLVGQYRVVLWGVEAAQLKGTSLMLKGRSALDDVIGTAPVSCQVVRWIDEVRASAVCKNTKGADLGLAMLQSGYAVTQRSVIAGTAYAEPYQTAEQAAQTRKSGIWADQGLSSTTAIPPTILGPDITQSVNLLLYGLLGTAGFAFLSFLILLILTQKNKKLLIQTIEGLKADENEIRSREKHVIAGMLEGELLANKGKLEAYTVVNRDLFENLKDMKSKGRAHRYQTSGEIVQCKPALTRAVYDRNTDKMALLGQQIARSVSDLYAKVGTEAEYFTLEPELPIDEAIAKVQSIVLEAENMMKPMDMVLNAIQIVLRDR